MRKTFILALLTLLAVTGTRSQIPGSVFAPKYRLGGLLYAGDFPINNPVNTGDLGYAMLFRIDGMYILPLDTLVFDSLGYYYFTDVEEGSYLIKAGLTTASAHSGEWLPAYYGDAAVWYGADTVTLSRDEFNLDIRMSPVQGYVPGEGEISGHVTGENPVDYWGSGASCEVVLSDTQFRTVSYTYADGNGAFAFHMVANGTYFVFAESTGLFSSKEWVQIDPEHPTAGNLEIHLFAAVQGIDPVIPDAPRVTLFPNPASGRVAVTLSACVFPVSVSLCSLLGETIHTERVEGTGSTQTISIGLSGVGPGVYLLTASGPAGNRSVKKLIVY